jgi:hypothetical protein
LTRKTGTGAPKMFIEDSGTAPSGQKNTSTGI